MTKALMDTEAGQIELELFEADAPKQSLTSSNWQKTGSTTASLFTV
jgi:cyclophilin family peptidyl-prolyl cis-trans isomerase